MAAFPKSITVPIYVTFHPCEDIPDYERAEAEIRNVLFNAGLPPIKVEFRFEEATDDM